MSEENSPEDTDQDQPELPARPPINFQMTVQPYPYARTESPSSPPTPSAAPASPPAIEEDDRRTSKQLELSEAINRYVPDGITSLAIGGMHMHNNPLALVRELVRQSIHIKRLITSPAASLNADLLIGAGLVEEIVTSYVGFEHLGLAPAYRRLAQSGQLRVLEVDELSLMLALRAGAANLPFVALPPGLEFSDVTRSNPVFYQPVTDPFTAQTALAVPSLRPQVALIACQQADRFGNLLFKGSHFADRELIMAAAVTLVQAEQIISSSLLTRNPLQVAMPGLYVSAVIEAPFGCHPTSSHRLYHYDEEHLKEYLQLAATADGFQQYLDKYVLNGGENEYLGRTTLAQW